MNKLIALAAFALTAPAARAAESVATAGPNIPAAFDVPGIREFLFVLFIVLALSAALTTIRILRGPSVPDRVVALDVLGNICAVTIALTAIGTGQPFLLAIALVIALIMFLGTTAFSLYLEKRVEL